VQLGINASPEPFSNIFVSLIEDGIVAVVIALVLAEPVIALAVVLVLLAIGIGLILLLRKGIRRAMKNRGRPPDDRGPPGDPEPAAPPSGPSAAEPRAATALPGIPRARPDRRRERSRTRPRPAREHRGWGVERRGPPAA
jgi:hypothetical protein